MTDEKLRELARKCHEGTATKAEQMAFDDTYKLLLRRHTHWDARLMGDEEIMKTEV